MNITYPTATPSLSYLGPGHFDAATCALTHLSESSHGDLHHYPGRLPVMVTSVHGFAHLRAGQVKAADTGTLAFSHLLAHASGASWLAVAKPDLPDSNHAQDTPFKQRLAQLLLLDRIGLVVDIHGAHASRPFDVDVGSMDQASWHGRLDLRDMLLNTLRQHGFYVTDNAVFKAYGSGADAETVTKFCASKGVPAVQLEVSNALLTDLGGRMALHQNAKLANALVQFIEYAGQHRRAL